MTTQTSKILLSIFITAVIASGGTYYFLSTQKTDFSTPSATIAEKNDTFNQSSKEYAIMGKQAFSAFQCSSWASKNDDQKEAERLFTFGYEQGKKFIGALGAQKIKQEDISSEVPIGVTMLLYGPSPDFMLGNIYSAAQEEALKDVFKTGDDFNADEVQKIVAGNKFRDGNCQLIGK